VEAIQLLKLGGHMMQGYSSQNRRRDSGALPSEHQIERLSKTFSQYIKGKISEEKKNNNSSI
jgi:hypothetical protein